VLQEGGLDEVQENDSDAQQDDDDDCALGGAELFTAERMTHADVPTPVTRHATPRQPLSVTDTSIV